MATPPRLIALLECPGVFERMLISWCRHQTLETTIVLETKVAHCFVRLYRPRAHNTSVPILQIETSWFFEQ